MHSQLAFVNSITIPFIKAGFTSKRAFANVVKNIDNSMDYWDLGIAWDYGICTINMEHKLDVVLETLKNE